MKPQNLIYTFVSYASHYDTPWGHGTAVEGVERTARLAHAHGIPVTWIVNRGSIPVIGEQIRQWHEAYGDDIILQCPFFMEEMGMSKDALKARLEADWNLVKEAFPWSTTKIAGRGKIYNEVIEVLEELDFQGMWGYCWEQVWWDGITHKGIPWGSWYVDSNRYKVPHTGKGKVVACEWTARDLHLSYHTGSPVIYSTDPNDVLRAGLCTGDEITYWQMLFDEYLANTDHNDQVFFLQQQEAHEMEFSDRFQVFPASHVAACEGMLDKFFAYVAQCGVTLTTLPKALATYHKRNQITAPSYMLTKDKPIRPEVNDYTMTLGGVAAGPWPDTFFFYDNQCQMVFVKGECKPRLVRNYVGQWNMQDEFEEKIPPLFITAYEKTSERIELVYEFGNWKPMPFGLTYWDEELSDYEIESCSSDVELKVIKDELVFLRFNLTGEKRTIRLVLRKML
ncbi:hypothetical protein ASG89_19365 [Paenibacillus sp. Soil766]|nr:hypothetical protein ASG89_19365 [Paenibacillus sp. Soil766]